MKRSFAFFALVCAILFGCAATAGAQSKALKKDVKKRVKELTKEGWKPLASSSTLEYAFSKYRTYLEEDQSIWIYKGCSCGTVLRVQPFSVI